VPALAICGGGADRLAPPPLPRSLDDWSLRCLAHGGRLVICGATTGHDARIDLRFLFSRQYSLLGSYMGTKAELLRAARFFFAGQLRPVIDRTFPLAEAADAHRRLERREQFGKIVLDV
jgi:NADPH:quinone reductase-like Zn-dependent oxidoreductase